MTITTEMLTWHIKNWADSTELKGCGSHLALCSLTGNRSEMPTFHISVRYVQVQKAN